MHIAKLLTLTFARSGSALLVVTLPWFGQVSLDGLLGHLGYANDLAEDRTIYQVLRDNEQCSYLVKVIDLNESVIDLLSDPSKSITFFAFPSLKSPPHHGHHTHENLLRFVTDSDNLPLGVLVQRLEELEKTLESPDKEKRKEALAHITRKVIEYHIPRSLAKRQTSFKIPRLPLQLT